MITKELLTANAALASLSEEQIKAIVALSENDENAVIAKKTGEIYGALDNDILTVGGIQKNGTEKTYDFAKRVITELREKADSVDGLNSKIKDLTAEKIRLEKVISENGADGETAKQLKQAKADLAAVTQQFNELNNKYQDSEKNHTAALLGLKIDNEISTALNGVTFKKGLPENVISILVKQATEKVKTQNPEYIDDGKGGKTLVFKGENGEVLRNPANQLNPYTAAELMTKEFETMAVLEKGMNQKGGGTGNPGAGGGNGGGVLSFGNVRTQSDAYTAISKNLMSQGFVIGSEEYQAEFNKAWTDNNVANLPQN